MSTKIDAPADDITLPATPEGIDRGLAAALRAYARRAVKLDRQRGDEKRHFICLCPDCTKPADRASTSRAAWIDVAARLPESGKAVLLDIGRGVPLRAVWAAKHTIQAGDEAPDDWAEYVEADDMYYCPEGWYEWNEHEETHWAVSATPLRWMTIPVPAAVDVGAAQAETALVAPALVDLLMDADEAEQIERAAGLLEDYHRFIGEHVKSDDLALHPYPPEIERAAEELRAIVARIGEFKPTTDYQLGHADGLEWAARQAEANDPRTGDWLFDDPHELAKALRKGPELPEGAAQAAPARCSYCDDTGDVHGLDGEWRGECTECSAVNGQQATYDRSVGKKWRENSRLELWFPLTAEELADLRAEVAKLRAAQAEPVAFQHVAVAENGVLRWMSGRKLPNCELYAMPDGRKAPPLYATPPAPTEQPSQDAALLDWLETMTVNVRTPLRYGSHDLFWATPEERDGEAPGPSDIRTKIAAARAAQAQGGKGGA